MMKLLFCLAMPVLSSAQCPFMALGTPSTDTVAVPDDLAFATALKTLDIAALERDLTALMTTSDTCWPADGGHYGGFMIRLAWHCAGTFREMDGRGGCEGGRIRFEPERSWEDNGNLQHARALLGGIKTKYGDALSWGDLMTFAGTVAIRSMGGPTAPQCFGRIDENSGAKSDIFGTTAHFQKTGCKVNGNCTRSEGLGAVKVGLIYVNPEGPLNKNGTGQNPDPAASAVEIREVFARMGMNDTETAALIVGGHAFGKCHGAVGTATSGFEGPWTTTPSQWSNEFLTGMLDEEWEKTLSPVGKTQWRTKDRSSKYAGTMRLTSDLALVHDDVYKSLAEGWVADPQKLETQFASAWNKLMTSGTVWSSAKRCENSVAEATPTEIPADAELSFATKTGLSVFGLMSLLGACV